MTRVPGWMRSTGDDVGITGITGPVLPQLPIDLGCRAFDVCHTNCRTLNIDYVDPYQFAVVTTSCQTKETCHNYPIFY
jgi:hypothetical protein